MEAYNFQPISKRAVLFIIMTFASFETLQIQGRPIKPTNKQEAKGHIPSSSELPRYFASENREAFPPPTPIAGFGDSDVENKDDFRPTTPGNSPGVGHHYSKNGWQNMEFEVASGTASSKVRYVEGFKDDFRPTTPGHSPGIGHITSEPKA